MAADITDFKSVSSAGEAICAIRIKKVQRTDAEKDVPQLWDKTSATILRIYGELLISK